jgi:hypothetical protein
VERANELWVRDAVSCRSGFTPDMLVSGINPDLQQTEFIGSGAKNPIGSKPQFSRDEPAAGFFAGAQNDKQGRFEGTGPQKRPAAHGTRSRNSRP